MNNVQEFTYRVKKELFIDKKLEQESSGVELKVHTPAEKPAEGAIVRGHYATILSDGDRFRRYFRDARNEGVTGYAESRDGIFWKMDVLSSRGGPEENAIMSAKQGCTHNFTPFIDTNPDCPAGERYKAVSGTYFEKGLDRYYSADGIHFTRYEGDRILPCPDGVHMLDSQNLAFWSEAEQQYVLYFRRARFYKGKEQRMIARTTSKDFKNWTPFIQFDDLNFEGENLYTSGMAPCYGTPHIYMGTPTRIFEEHGFATDIGLLFYRPESGFVRPLKEAWIAPGSEYAAWANRANYLALNPVKTGPDELSFYHNFNGKRYTMQPDRYVSLHTGFDGGRWLSKPLRCPGKYLNFNVATTAGGEVRVGLRDAGGNPVPGYTCADSIPFYGDRPDYEPRWKKPDSKEEYPFYRQGFPVKPGEVFQIELEMREADVFAVEFKDHTDKQIWD